MSNLTCDRWAEMVIGLRALAGRLHAAAVPAISAEMRGHSDASGSDEHRGVVVPTARIPGGPGDVRRPDPARATARSGRTAPSRCRQRTVRPDTLTPYGDGAQHLTTGGVR